jgi:hypothetical protein
MDARVRVVAALCVDRHQVRAHEWAARRRIRVVLAYAGAELEGAAEKRPGRHRPRPDDAARGDNAGVLVAEHDQLGHEVGDGHDRTLLGDRRRLQRVRDEALVLVDVDRLVRRVLV